MKNTGRDQLPTEGDASVIVFVRHSAGCPYEADRFSRRCNCRKHLYVRENGKAIFKSAKTRSWAVAQKLAAEEMSLRDPVNRKLREIADQEAAKLAAKRAAAITVNDALNRWLTRQKSLVDGSFKAYESFTRKVRRWAERKKVEYLGDVTANMLDEWRGQWSKEAELKDDCMGATTQSTFQGRLQRLFDWAASIKLIDSDPAARLEYIKPSEKRTNVLTQPQFEELLNTIEQFTAVQGGECRHLSKEFRALFLLQRWAGLRILDCLALPRSGLVGNRLKLKTQKNGADVDRILPDHVVAALGALSPDRSTFKPGYFLWSVKCQKENLTSKWDEYIQTMNRFLSFRDEEGQPMRFHSHMLRDTYAVEMLLAGVSLEDVSRLLTHKSVRTTEMYYAHWIRARREHLEEKSIDAMRRMGVKVGGK